ncbi:MAG: hypothetical protein HY365_03920, partial [Candidatus Aenigmarchaeota archaeon]|nr:hypothetical protein [Candidatus Aenigmarchaeota archaeon]
MAQLKAVGIPRNFYNKRQQISQSLETIHSSGFVGAAGADASRTLSVDDLTNKGYRIMSVTFSCTASDSGSGTLSFQVNDEEIQSYSTDTAARTFAATYFIRDW